MTSPEERVISGTANWNRFSTCFPLSRRAGAARLVAASWASCSQIFSSVGSKSGVVPSLGYVLLTDSACVAVTAYHFDEKRLTFPSLNRSPQCRPREEWFLDEDRILRCFSLLCPARAVVSALASVAQSVSTPCDQVGAGAGRR